MLDDLPELLITHHVGGRWRAPLSARMRDITGPGGRPLGRLVEAEAPDLARALAAAGPAAAALDAMGRAGRDALAARFEDEVAARRPLLERLRRREGFSGGLAPATVTLPAMAPGPLGCLGSVQAPPRLVAGTLAAALRDGRPVLLKPAPRAPLCALVLAEALLAAGAPPGTLGLLQGGGTVTGAALRRLPGLGGVVLLGKAPRDGLAGVTALRAPRP